MTRPTYQDVLDAINEMNTGGNVSRSQVNEMIDRYNARPGKDAELLSEHQARQDNDGMGGGMLALLVVAGVVLYGVLS